MKKEDENLNSVDDVIYNDIVDDVDNELLSSQRDGDAIDYLLGLDDEDIKEESAELF